MALVSEATLLDMATHIEQHLGAGRTYSMTDVRAVLFGTRSARDRVGVGRCGIRWAGLNAGEQMTVVGRLVEVGLLEEEPKGKRFVYRLA